MRVDVMGVGFDNVTMEEALDQAMALLQTGTAHYAVTPNAEIVYECMHDAEFCSLVNQADLVLPDGSGVVLGAKLLKTPLKQKVAGIDFADQLAGRLARAGKTLYLLAVNPGRGEQAAPIYRQNILVCKSWERLTAISRTRRRLWRPSMQPGPMSCLSAWAHRSRSCLWYIIRNSCRSD